MLHTANLHKRSWNLVEHHHTLLQADELFVGGKIWDSAILQLASGLAQGCKLICTSARALIKKLSCGFALGGDIIKEILISIPVVSLITLIRGSRLPGLCFGINDCLLLGPVLFCKLFLVSKPKPILLESRVDVMLSEIKLLHSYQRQQPPW